jgi:excisionase family DNA binding protein
MTKDQGNQSPEPLAVSPAKAWKMLDIGNTHGYELIKSGELESYRDGKSRKITVASIKARIARLVAAQGASATCPVERT